MHIDAIQVIKDRLTMREVLERYGFSAKRRIPCPLHNGKDENFEIKGNNWRCYSHCGSGDIISFVQKLFGLSFQDALRKIDADFGLNIYGDHSFEELRRSHYQRQALIAKQEREKEERQRADAQYISAYEKYIRLDRNMREYAPKTSTEEWHPLFVEALRYIDYYTYVLDYLDGMRVKK